MNDKPLQRNPQDEERLMRAEIDRSVKAYMASGAFTTRKIGDTPTDALSLVPRKFVTANGLLANRPIGSVATVGQFYLPTDTNVPMWYTTGGWRNSVGSVVAS